MNKIIYTFAIALLALLASSCKGNDNWVIVETIQPGAYVTGEATPFSGAAPASALQPLKDLDPKETKVPSHILAIYTYLKSGKPFQVTIATSADKVETYGAGAMVSESTTAKVYQLATGTTGFTVAEDGLYRIVLNTEAKQVHILPVRWGVIGSATPNGWNGETPLPTVEYDATNFTITYKGKVVLSSGEYKFRYSGEWGYPLDAGKEVIKFHTNIGGSAADVQPPISGGLINSQPGGDNLTAKLGGEYELSVVYKLRDRTFQVSAKLIGEPTPAPTVTLPENMYLIGSINGWSWDNASEMIPVHGMKGPNGEKGTSKYWSIQYLKAGDAFKANSIRSWDNSLNFDNVAEATKQSGIVEKDNDNNIKVTQAGWYLILITTQIKDNTLQHSIELVEPNIYLVGASANNQWSTPNESKFTIPTEPNGRFISPAATHDGELRIAVALEGIDWWKAEFIVREGKLEFRGDGPDQEPRVPIAKGQHVELDFTQLTGAIK